MINLNLPNIKRIALFSDIHWGKSKDNYIKLNSTVSYINWFISQCKNHNVDAVIFAGDWFDNRNSINVTTLNIAFKAINKIAQNFPIYLILGNHDIALKNSNKVHSLISFNNIDNVKIIDELTALNTLNHNILLVPWNIPIPPESKYDILVGHFEFNGAQVAQNNELKNSNPNTYDIKSLCEVAPLVFTGHFHLHKEYLYSDRKLIVIGSTIELDWGDYNNEKGFYIYDLQTRTYEFIKNNISPIHVKYYFSKIKDIFKDIQESEIKNNYVKLIVDQAFNYNDIINIINYINSLGPIRKCETDFIFNISEHIDGVDLQDQDQEIKMTKFDYIKKFITKMDDLVFTNCNLTKEFVIKKAEYYYQNAEKEIDVNE